MSDNKDNNEDIFLTPCKPTRQKAIYFPIYEEKGEDGVIYNYICPEDICSNNHYTNKTNSEKKWLCPKCRNTFDTKDIQKSHTNTCDNYLIFGSF